MEGIARIGRFTIDLTEQMGRMMLFVLSSFAWLTRPPFRFYQIVKQLNFIGSNPPSWSCSPLSSPAWSSRFGVLHLAKIRVRRPCWARPWRSSIIRELGPVLRR